MLDHINTDNTTSASRLAFREERLSILGRNLGRVSFVAFLIAPVLSLWYRDATFLNIPVREVIVQTLYLPAFVTAVVAGVCRGVAEFPGPFKLRDLRWGFIVLYVASLSIFGALSEQRRNETTRHLGYNCFMNLRHIGEILEQYSATNGEFPELSPSPGLLMFPLFQVLPVLRTEPKMATVFRCIASPRIKHVPPNLYTLVDDNSYFYLGYALRNDADVEAFANAYRKRIAEGRRFDEDIQIAENGDDRDIKVIYRLRKGVEEHLVTDPNNPGAIAKVRAEIPVIVERVGNHPNDAAVLYLDGHADFVAYPGKWPMTEKTMGILEALHNLRALRPSRP